MDGHRGSKSGQYQLTGRHGDITDGPHVPEGTDDRILMHP